MPAPEHEQGSPASKRAVLLDYCGQMLRLRRFAGPLLLSEALWRVGLLGMDELLAKDAAFYHGNFAGSLTKRTLSFATRFEEFADTLMFNVAGNLVPIVIACVILWRYSPDRRPLLERVAQRQQLARRVDVRPLRPRRVPGAPDQGAGGVPAGLPRDCNRCHR
jgi:hypothetical protein